MEQLQMLSKTMLKIRETRKKKKHISKCKYLIFNSHYNQSGGVNIPVACSGVRQRNFDLFFTVIHLDTVFSLLPSAFFTFKLTLYLPTLVYLCTEFWLF
jgi:hypothetical protein